jgi:hypothetical protein
MSLRKKKRIRKNQQEIFNNKLKVNFMEWILMKVEKLSVWYWSLNKYYVNEQEELMPLLSSQTTISDLQTHLHMLWNSQQFSSLKDNWRYCFKRTWSNYDWVYGNGVFYRRKWVIKSFLRSEGTFIRLYRVHAPLFMHSGSSIGNNNAALNFI